MPNQFLKQFLEADSLRNIRFSTLFAFGDVSCGNVPSWQRGSLFRMHFYCSKVAWWFLINVTELKAIGSNKF